MRKHDVRGGELSIFSTLPGGHERILFLGGVRCDDAKGTRTPYAITYSYPEGGGSFEHESMEVYNNGDATESMQISRKYVVRENCPPNTVIPVLVWPLGANDASNLGVAVETLGYTIFGGDPINPREDWVRMTNSDQAELERVFGHSDLTGRQPNATGTFVVLKSTPDHPLIAPCERFVNGRMITIHNVGEITLNLGPDVGGKPGRSLKAFFRMARWSEGPLRGGDMAS